MQLTSILSVSVFLLRVSSTPIRSRSPYALKESHHVPRKWARIGAAPSEHMLNLRIGLRQDRFDELEQALWEVSDPTHQRYGQHLSSSQVDELVKPSNDSLELVHQWLADNGIESARLDYSRAKDWIKVSLPVKEVESLLDTKYSIFKHKDSDDFIVRTPSWSLPKHLHSHIEVIQPTNSFFRPKALRSNLKIVEDSDTVFNKQAISLTGYNNTTPNISDVCVATAVTPTCLRTLYGTYSYTPQALGENLIGYANYLNETSNRSDVSLFLQKYRPEAVAVAYDFNIEIINNGDNQQTPNTPEQLSDGKDLEGNLDAETILGITWPTNLTAYNTGGSPPFIPDGNTPTNTNEPYLVWLDYILEQSDLPGVISTSYGDGEQTVPESYAKAACKGFAQLGARGTSVLFSSGDSGVGPEGDCVSNDGKNRTIFTPAFPASCPYVTAVGATMNFFPEVSAYNPNNGFASGSGFSNYFSRPAYQTSAVKKYLSGIGSLYKGLYNPNGRAYPDISAQGFHYLTVWSGRVVVLDGTSASSPAAAAIIGLVNDALIAAGKPTLGFLNPWLYGGGYKAFTDVTNGTAIGCGVAGFPTAVGWDPVTGWGTPYFPKLKRAALQEYA
ncbi:hypothetical protein ACMFMG_004253 [Clarireedia jacksonii]